MVRFANMAVQTAQKNHAKKVTGVTIRVGEMTGLVPDYLQRYYPQAVKGTILEGSQLTILYEPVKLECTCGHVYTPSKENGYACPVCKGTSGHLISGRQMDLVSVQIED